MRLEYIGLSELSGSLIALEGVKDVAYDEMAEVTLENGERRYGRVILIDGDRVVLQVFEGTRGISLENASTHFTRRSGVTSTALPSTPSPASTLEAASTPAYPPSTAAPPSSGGRSCPSSPAPA